VKLWDYLAECRQEMRGFGRSTMIALAIVSLLIALFGWL